MPQLFQVLKCFKCSVFQVHQTKKSNKWECKLCGEKQSMKRHYGLGTAKECRLHVQKLNGMRGDIDELNEMAKLTETSDEENDQIEDDRNPKKYEIKLPKTASKWLKFSEKIDGVKEPEINEPMYLGNSEVVLEVPAKKRKFTKPKAVGNASIVHSSNLEDFENVRKSASPAMIVYETVKPYEPGNHVLKTEQCRLINANAAAIKNSEIRTVNSFVPHSISKNSKWAQFKNDDEEDHTVDDHFVTNDENEQNVIPTLANNSRNTDNKLGMNMFALCDENDLDDVLHF